MKTTAADTPLMQQYEKVKSKHPDEIVFFRLGDFYEMFGEDAQRAAPILEVALTHRQSVPMCGVPYHAVNRYLSKLIKKGYRVAIAEQLEDPAAAKGLVKREVVRVISSGTLIEENLLTEKKNNYLTAIYIGEEIGTYGCAYLDVSTGEFKCSENNTEENWNFLKNELAVLNPAELLVSKLPKELEIVLNGIPTVILPPEECETVSTSQVFSKEVPNWENSSYAKKATAMILTYLERSNRQFLENLQPVEWANSECMQIDKETLENLEILKNSFDGSTSKTLIDFLDQTLTPMGARLFRQWLARPLMDGGKIKERLEAVEFFADQISIRLRLRQALKNCSDFERILTRILTHRASPHDLIHLKNSILNLQGIKEIFKESSAQNIPQKIKTLLIQISKTGAAAQIIQASIQDEPSATLENGGVIQKGFDASLDEKREALELGNSWLQELEKKEKGITGISTLRVGYTSVFGYYFEVTKPHLPKVPPHWHRKQTLINNERFTNEELKNLEVKILGAQEQSLRLEKQLYQTVLDSLKLESALIQKISKAISELDCFLSLAEAAEKKGLTKPHLQNSKEIQIKEGWHPVVKESLPSGTFVPNDTQLNCHDHQIIILTGPNMSGKSTYLRQVALITWMAHIGSFVSAKEARISLVDCIFTRIGSGDRLAQGQSTFMVEMQETSKILKQSTSKSLIILDEVGRGTSTYDGISIAWAIVEYLAKKESKVLFATHYFELTQLEKLLPKVKNYNVEAKEWKDSVLFLHKICAGPADRSYGIHVAQLAGLPLEVIERSSKLLIGLELEHKTLLELNEKELNPQTELFL